MTGSRRVLVTGASSGIGRASALALARTGASLVLVSRSETALDEVARECVGLGGSAQVIVADVSDAAAVTRAFGEATSNGTLHGVIHSAAVLSYGRFEQVPAEVFDQAVKTTLLGTANVARSALEVFGHQGGRGSLVVIGSLLGKIATPYMSSYVTAKWGVHGLVRTLQIEARSTPGIRISLISPGGVDTPVYRQAGTYLTRHGRPPPPVDPPEKVADAAVAALQHSQRERYVGIANGVVVAGFRFLPAVFDLLVSPLMRLGGLTDSHVAPTPGNVLEPQPDGESLRAGWSRWGGRR
ncbi:MAG: SDR family NAD(P)-dependent oxidoreductase [Terracoccus sp.]